MSPVLPILRGDNKVALSCKLRDGLSVTEVPRCKGKQKSRKSKTFGCFFEVRGARYENTSVPSVWINISCVYSHSSHLVPRTSYLEKNLVPRKKNQSLYAAVSSQILMMTCMAFCMDWMLTNS